MYHAYFITGGNMGDREEQLSIARRMLTERCGTLIDQSSVYETEPWGKTDQPPFLNQVLVIETALPAREVMKEVHLVEHQMGRERTEKNGPRTIDVDLLFFDHQIISEIGLTVPHPQIPRRRFVLEPLNEVAPAYIHPAFFKTIKQMLDECTDNLRVKKYEA